MSKINFRYALFTAVLALGITLNACITWKQIDPLALGNDENTGTVQFNADFVDPSLSAKINGENIAGKFPLVILPAGMNEYEILVKIHPIGGGLIRMSRTDIVIGKIPLDIAAGKMYRLSPVETTGSSVGAFFLGVLMPTDYRFILMERNEEAKKWITLGEFPGIKLDKEVWDTYEFPMMTESE